MVGIGDIRAAARRLEGVADRTPVLRSRLLDEVMGARVSLKAKSLKRTGSFKFRGAYNRTASIPQRQMGVLAFSSGNHGQAVALAARLLATSSTIVMPADAPSIKLEATRRYGAEVITYDRYSEDREQIGLQICRTARYDARASVRRSARHRRAGRHGARASSRTRVRCSCSWRRLVAAV